MLKAELSSKSQKRTAKKKGDRFTRFVLRFLSPCLWRVCLPFSRMGGKLLLVDFLAFMAHRRPSRWGLGLCSPWDSHDTAPERKGNYCLTTSISDRIGVIGEPNDFGIAGLDPDRVRFLFRLWTAAIAWGLPRLRHIRARHPPNLLSGSFLWKHVWLSRGHRLPFALRFEISLS